MKLYRHRSSIYYNKSVDNIKCVIRLLTGSSVTLFSGLLPLLSRSGALLLLPANSIVTGSVVLSCKLAVEGEESARGKEVSTSSPELTELLAVVDRPTMCTNKKVALF